MIYEIASGGIEVKIPLLHNQFISKNNGINFSYKNNFQTTGLTGLNVSQHPHHVLAALYSKTLRALVKMPENAAYRIHTEKIIRERANIVSTVRNTPYSYYNYFYC